MQCTLEGLVPTPGSGASSCRSVDVDDGCDVAGRIGEDMRGTEGGSGDRFIMAWRFGVRLLKQVGTKAAVEYRVGLHAAIGPK